MLIHKGKNWIDFKVFCQMLKTGLQLGDYFDKSNFGYYYEKGMEDYELYSDLSFILFNRNLMRFGCVEVREEIKEYGIKRIVAFRSTKIGLYLFEKDLEGYW